MKEKNKKSLSKVAAASLLLSSLSAFTNSADASLMSFKILGSGSEIRNSLLNKTASVHGVTYGADNSKDTGEGKCGEGKCGDTKKVATPTPHPAKDAEMKCGEGKCG